MFYCTLTCIISLILVVFQASSLQEDYYRRHYIGSIPEDAIIGGKNAEGSDVYIGQVYDRNVGLIAVQINPGVKEVIIPIFDKIRKASKHISILCGSQDDFYWLRANASDLHLTLLEKHAVNGGHIDNYGEISIGRISQEGETKIGIVVSYNVGNAYFIYNNDGVEKRVPSYEILVYGYHIDRC
ncbi:hypothetical protein BDFB_003909 [Asbolus verrucosus]|uniref:DUF3421 domain containing protein n=1 Tax=Asbolus verrucosus TaxID=1661398 RepID=A0A482VNC0_ASBVE|nr:hypothetical protein BDFB_003909 [Asbolus verrucosus]